MAPPQDRCGWVKNGSLTRLRAVFIFEMEAFTDWTHFRLCRITHT